jgi:hypothetical protein
LTPDELNWGQFFRKTAKPSILNLKMVSEEDDEWDRKMLVCWLNMQGFPSAMVASGIEDLRDGATLAELCDVVMECLLPEAPCSLTSLPPVSLQTAD